MTRRTRLKESAGTTSQRFTTANILSRPFPKKIAQALVAKQNFALVMLKVDNLAEFRQKYGDKTAAKALKQVGGALEKDLRGTDMVARYDNEKFVIFLANSDEKGTKTVAGRLSENIKNFR